MRYLSAISRAFRRLSLSSRIFVALLLISVVTAVAIYRRGQLCCAPAPIRLMTEQRPDDAWFELSSQTGSVSPEYFHRYRLRISQAGSEFTYTPGYDTSAPVWRAEYALSAAILDSLWTDFHAHSFWLLPTEKALRPDEVQHGAGSSVLTMFGNGWAVVLTDDRRDAAADRVRAYIQRFTGLVPDSLLRVYQARQAALPRR